jgi:hypothetical protein
MDAPIPLLAPVTTATRPDQRSIFDYTYPESIYSHFMLTDIEDEQLLGSLFCLHSLKYSSLRADVK